MHLLLHGILGFSILHLISTLNIHIDITNGTDTKQCGGVQQGCKTLDYAWETYLYTSNSTFIVFILSPPGGHFVTTNQKDLMFNCLESNVTDITVTSASSSSQVTLQHGVMISYCTFTFKYIKFQETTPQSFTNSNIIIYNSSYTNMGASTTFLQCNVTIEGVKYENTNSYTSKHLADQGMFFTHSNFVTLKNLIFRNNTLKELFTIDTAENIVIHSLTFDSNINSILLIKDIQEMSLVNLNLTNNTNTVIKLQTVTNTSKYGNILIKDNRKFSFSVLRSDITLNGFVLKNNKGNIGGNEYVQIESSNFTIKKGIFTCNKYLNTIYGSPLHIDEKRLFHCKNCSVYTCPLSCGAGKAVDEDILCTPCTAGMSSHEWQHECSFCLVGTYSSMNGSVDCLPCHQGYYCDHSGCTSCSKCTNDFFTSNIASSTCSKMSTLFIALIAVVVILTFGPIACLVIKKSRKENDVIEDESEFEEEELMVNQREQRDNLNEPLVIN